jgi:hypothetical protein
MAFNIDRLFEADDGFSVVNAGAGLVRSGKGVAFFSDAHSQKVTYTVGGDVDYIEFFYGETQITANRMLKISISYTSGDPSSETWEFYDSDGTTVLETRVYTYTVSSGSIQSVTESIT